jgi:hypothetical protein
MFPECPLQVVSADEGPGLMTTASTTCTTVGTNREQLTNGVSSLTTFGVITDPGGKCNITMNIILDFISLSATVEVPLRECVLGEYLTSSKTCADCISVSTLGVFANTFDPDPTKWCNPCPSGTYNDDFNRFATTCSACPAGTYRTDTGAASLAECLLCSEGFYAPLTGTANCLLCPALAQSDTSLTTAFRSCYCPAGTFKAKPIIPLDNTTNMTGITTTWECLSCPAGKYSSENNATACDSCPVGKANQRTPIN